MTSLADYFPHSPAGGDGTTRRSPRIIDLYSSDSAGKGCYRVYMRYIYSSRGDRFIASLSFENCLFTTQKVNSKCVYYKIYSKKSSFNLYMPSILSSS